MSRQRPELITGDIYHIYNRGVEKRDIFSEESDYYRFVFSLYECNDRNMVRVRERRGQRKKLSSAASGSEEKSKKREKLVEILAFCLMPNHYHIIARQVSESGISIFAKKLGDSYVGYFNKKHARKGMGSLFQGKYKAVQVENDNQFINLVCYVLANPVGIVEPGWKGGRVKDSAAAIDFLNSYRWSSYFDCVGMENFPSVADLGFLWNVFSGSDFDGSDETDESARDEIFLKGRDNIKKNVEEWILSKADPGSDIPLIDRLIFE